jgi:hypothetical protein
MAAMSTWAPKPPPSACDARQHSTLSPTLAAAPAGAAFRGYQVIRGEFVAVAAAALRQDSRPGAFRAEEREY